jgi:flagellar hook-associated protein 2
MSLTLKKAAPGQPVDLGANRPLDMIKQTVGDFVDVYNQLKKSLQAASKLSGVTTGLRDLETQLQGLVNKVLTSHGSISKLSDIGISTAKDGTLSLDKTKLDAVLASDAGAVEGLFNPLRDGTHNETTDPGIAGMLDAIRDKAIASDGVIGRVEKSLSDKNKSLADQLSKVEEREAAYKARLEKQYSALDVKLNAFKATQAYLEQQIKMWTKSDD